MGIGKHKTELLLGKNRKLFDCQIYERHAAVVCDQTGRHRLTMCAGGISDGFTYEIHATPACGQCATYGFGSCSHQS